MESQLHLRNFIKAVSFTDDIIKLTLSSCWTVSVGNVMISLLRDSLYLKPSSLYQRWLKTPAAEYGKIPAPTHCKHWSVCFRMRMGRRWFHPFCFPVLFISLILHLYFCWILFNHLAISELVELKLLRTTFKTHYYVYINGRLPCSKSKWKNMDHSVELEHRDPCELW